MTRDEEVYVTLFCEGDGSIGLNGKGYPVVNFCQMDRNVLNYISSLLVNGHFYQNSQTGLWRLVFDGSYCIPLLEAFSRCVAGRRFLERLNDILKHVDMPQATQHPLTFNGFIAFWDAEGSSDNSPSIFVVQKDREILDLITEMFEGGVSPQGDIAYQWHLSGDRARKLLPKILDGSHHPPKVERLRKNFGGPNYYELHTEHHREYDKAHKEEQKLHNKKYNTEHAEEIREGNKRRWAEQKAIREYMKIHPVVAAKLGGTAQ